MIALLKIEFMKCTIVPLKKNGFLAYKQTDLKDCLPYIEGLSERLRKSLKKCNINVYFANKYTLSRFPFFKKKDKDNVEKL